MQTPAYPPTSKGSRRTAVRFAWPSWPSWTVRLRGLGLSLGLGLGLVGCGAGLGQDDGAAVKSAASIGGQEESCWASTPGSWTVIGGDVVVTPGCKKSRAPGWGLGVNGRHVLFANFEGVDVRQGDNALENEGLRNPDLNSKGVIELDMFDGNGSNRNETILKIQRQVAAWYADMNVDIVISRPLSGDYLMTVVGGKQGDIVQMSGVVGISPGDCKNNVEANLNYAFSGSLSENPDQTAVTIAHEAGHAYGLGHTLNMKDIMYPSVSTVTGFESGEVADPGPCNAMQFDVQDSHQVLVDNLGKRSGGKPSPSAADAPSVEILSPKDGQAMSRDVTIAVKAEGKGGLEIDHVTLSVSRLEAGRYRGNHPVAELRPPQSAAQVRLTTAGSFQITATAYDKVGNVALTQSTVTVAAATCAAPNDCAPGQKCDGGQCVTPPLASVPAGMTATPDMLRAYGTACEKSSECVGGLCGITPVGQICTHYCNPDRLCAGGLECVDGICQPQTVPRATAKPGQLGGKCTRNQDCFTGECSPSVDATTPRYCTKTCDPDLGWSCPSTMTCTLSDGAGGMKNRCIAKPVGQEGGGDGGCAIGGVSGRATSQASAGGLSAMALLGLALGLVRRRRAS